MASVKGRAAMAVAAAQASFAGWAAAIPRPSTTAMAAKPARGHGMAARIARLGAHVNAKNGAIGWL
jgi:hypothetical protein